MSNRPNSGTKSHRRAESGGHYRQSSSGSGHHRTDSGQSFDLDNQRERKHGHHRSRSGAYEKSELRHDSSGSQCMIIIWIFMFRFKSFFIIV